MTTPQTMAEAVLEFQRKIGAEMPAEMRRWPRRREATDAIRRAGIELKNLSSYLKGIHVDCQGQDPRALRAELMLEELGESLEAMADCDELLLLDGLADLLYVVIGTGTTFDLPLERAFREVHRSNMTKEPGLQHAAGKTGKGPAFQPPKLRRLLNIYRGKTMCDRCCWAQGDVRGGRLVVLKQVGAQRVCTGCLGDGDGQVAR